MPGRRHAAVVPDARRETGAPVRLPAGTAVVTHGLLMTVVLATVLAPLNSTMIAVALPGIIDHFHATVPAGSWLVVSYLIAMAVLQPLAGTLGDRLGRRPLLLGGLVLFALASLGAAIASTLPLLLLCRVQQAVAGALAVPNGTALIREAVPAERRGRYFGLVGTATALAAAAGPPLGGFLVAVAGWQAIFYVNLLLILPALLLGWNAIPRNLAPQEAFSCGPLPQPAGVRQPGQCGHDSVHGRRQPAERRLHLFRHRGFAAAVGAVALSNLAMYVTLLAVPLLLAHRPGYGTGRIGLVLLALSGTMALFSPLGGHLADRRGRRYPVVIGLSLLALGLASPAVMGTRAVPLLVGGLAIAGAGLGLAGAGLQAAAVEAVRPGASGAAAGVFSTSRYLGSIVGTVLLTVLLGAGDETALFPVVLAAALLSALASLGLAGRPKTGS